MQRRYSWSSLALVLIGGTVFGVGCAESQRPVDHSLEEAREFPEDNGSDEQRSALADGVVSVDEYRSAIEAMLHCFDGAGLDYEVDIDWSGLTYDYVVSSSLEASGVESTYQECYETHAAAVDAVHQMSIDDQRTALLLDIGACLDDEVGEDTGVPNASDLNEIEVVQMTRALHPQAWELCVSTVVPPSHLPQM